MKVSKDSNGDIYIELTASEAALLAAELMKLISIKEHFAVLPLDDEANLIFLREVTDASHD